MTPVGEADESAEVLTYLIRSCRWLFVVRVNDVQMHMEIDTGSTVLLISKAIVT